MIIVIGLDGWVNPFQAVFFLNHPLPTARLILQILSQIE